jgi:hypothetical protein
MQKSEKSHTDSTHDLVLSPDKGCLTGTRVAFLDFIINWVNNPATEHGLVLLGQAGTGKSLIAHEIARLFDKMHRLTSSFIFVRREQSVRKAYHLFTTLARDLADRYPSFKIALGKVVKDNTALRVGTRDYHTLFESLILEPLKDLHIVGPILVVIDALDESGDTTRAARRTVTAYGRILTGRLRHDDVTYPYRKIELETSIRYGTGSDTAENGCTAGPTH